MDVRLGGSLPLDLFITEHLATRPAAAPDYLREKQAIQELAAQVPKRAREILPRFVRLAMTLTGGTTAGISLYEAEPSPGVFRWHYLQGELERFDQATTPRNYSPCGITLDQDSPILVSHPERYYSWLVDAGVVLPEVLLVPLHFGDKDTPVGTLWVVGDDRHFNAEHARIVEELAAFVSMAMGLLTTEERLQSALLEQETLTKEMSHRIKNLFAVSEGMVRMTMRSATSKEEMGQSLIGRFHALASAHGMIRRSFSPDGTPPTVPNLVELLKTVLEPHERHLTGHASRFTISGPSVACGEHALNGIALIFHELATNAVKYGALASEEGHISLSWGEGDGSLLFQWKETGGPTLAGEPQMAGFGSKLLADTVQRQFGGEIRQAWETHGLKVEVVIPIRRLMH